MRAFLGTPCSAGGGGGAQKKTRMGLVSLDPILTAVTQRKIYRDKGGETTLFPRSGGMKLSSFRQRKREIMGNP